MADNELVYSTNDPGKKKGRSPKNKQSKGTQPAVSPTETHVLIRLEKKGRGGKQVTVVYNLPTNNAFCKTLAKELKQKIGCGGVYKNGQIEIQGDHRSLVQEFFADKEFKVKLTGG